MRMRWGVSGWAAKTMWDIWKAAHFTLFAFKTPACCWTGIWTTKPRTSWKQFANSSDSLLTIVNEILDFSKIESGKLELERQPLDLVRCAEDAVDLLSARGREAVGTTG